MYRSEKLRIACMQVSLEAVSHAGFEFSLRFSTALYYLFVRPWDLGFFLFSAFLRGGVSFALRLSLSPSLHTSCFTINTHKIVGLPQPDAIRSFIFVLTFVLIPLTRSLNFAQCQPIADDVDPPFLSTSAECSNPR